MIALVIEFGVFIIVVALGFRHVGNHVARLVERVETIRVDARRHQKKVNRDFAATATSLGRLVSYLVVVSKGLRRRLEKP